SSSLPSLRGDQHVDRDLGAEDARLARLVVDGAERVDLAVERGGLLVEAEESEGQIVDGRGLDRLHRLVAAKAKRRDADRLGEAGEAVVVLAQGRELALGVHRDTSLVRERRKIGLPVRTVRAGAKSCRIDSGQAVKARSETLSSVETYSAGSSPPAR